MLRRSVVLGILVLAGLASAANAACPKQLFHVDLKTCVVHNPLGAFVTDVPGVPGLPPPPPNCTVVSAGCGGGFRQAVYKIAIPPGCRQANVVVEYEGLPKGWTVNLGDSPTNNGFAGDAGTTTNDAELWIVEENLSVAASDHGLANVVATAHLALKDGSVKLVAKDHSVSWGNPFTFLQAPAAPNNFLFAIPDPDVPGEGRNIYLGLNRVISGPGDRTGCGARRALVSFQ